MPEWKNSHQKPAAAAESVPPLEKDLPAYLRESIDAMNASWEIMDAGGKDIHWDLNWCELYSDINYAETERQISSAQAWHLRREYLRMEEER
ncbi:MAG: hypothetical protein II914_09885 [Clostridia bacterium]|nr:hypothetical protein [Clostridia bacterium]MBQ3815423.1 hypothetical protein [Clostridia bacterium]MBQ6426679.1 hypothetical protein [Clostridia bacterium]